MSDNTNTLVRYAIKRKLLGRKIEVRVTEDDRAWLDTNWNQDRYDTFSAFFRQIILTIRVKGITLLDGQKLKGKEAN